MALIGVIGAVGAAANAGASIFGSSDPAKDAERFARIDAAFQGAISDDQSSIECLDDMANKRYGGVRCAVGSTTAVNYARQKWAEYQQLAASGKLTSGGPLGGITGKATPQFLAIAALAVVAFLMLRKR